MSEFAYIAKAAAASDVTTPTGWPDGWTVPSTSSGPWPPGFPHTPAATYTLELTINDWLYAGGPMSLTVRTLLSGANTSALNGELIETSAAIGATAVQVKKESADSFANQVYHRVTNYSGAAYGFTDSIILDLDSGDDGSTVTVTSTVMSTSTEFTSSDTLVANNPIILRMGGNNGSTTTYTQAIGYSSTAEASFAQTSMSQSTSQTEARGWTAGKAYVTCGSNLAGTSINQANQVWDAATDTWNLKSFAPTPARTRCAGAIISSTFVLFYGINTSAVKLKDCDKYTISTDAWAAQTDGPTPTRDYLTGCAIGTKAYAMAGDDGASKLKDNDEFDGSSWTSKTDTPAPGRREASAVGIGTKAYLCGGTDGSDLADTDIYDQSGNSWSAGTSMGTAWSQGSVATMGGNAFFGGNSSGNARHYKYTVSGDTWAELALLAGSGAEAPAAA